MLPPSTAAAPEAAAGQRPGSGWPDVLVVVGLTLVAGLATALGFFHLAWRWGTVPLPISPIVLAAVVWFLCRSAFALTAALRMAVLPWAGCFVVVVLLFFAGNPGEMLPLRVVTMDYQTMSATDGDWRGLTLLGVLALTAAVQISLLWAMSVRDQRPSDPPPPPGDGEDAGPQHVTPTTSGPSGARGAAGGVDTGQ